MEGDEVNDRTNLDTGGAESAAPAPETRKRDRKAERERKAERTAAHRRPYVGCPVQFVGQFMNGETVHAAVATRVISDDVIDLTAFPPGGGLEFRAAIAYTDDQAPTEIGWRFPSEF